MHPEKFSPLSTVPPKWRLPLWYCSSSSWAVVGADVIETYLGTLPRRVRVSPASRASHPPRSRSRTRFHVAVDREAVIA